MTDLTVGFCALPEYLREVFESLIVAFFMLVLTSGSGSGVDPAAMFMVIVLFAAVIVLCPSYRNENLTVYNYPLEGFHALYGLPSRISAMRSQACPSPYGLQA